MALKLDVAAEPPPSSTSDLTLSLHAAAARAALALRRAAPAVAAAVAASSALAVLVLGGETLAAGFVSGLMSALALALAAGLVARPAAAGAASAAAAAAAAAAATPARSAATVFTAANPASAAAASLPPLAARVWHAAASRALAAADDSGAGISLVGCGPGRAELLTLEALGAIWAADVVICDRILGAALKELVRPGAELVLEAEKLPGRADAAQAELNAWGVGALRKGKRVARLKAGDPFLFGRGGEEVLFYRRHGFEPAVVPGVSSCLAAPLAAGIPVTHRGFASQLLVTTAQAQGGAAPRLPAFEPARTVVVLMGVGRIPSMASDYAAAGYPLDTPVAIIERATQRDERVTRSTLRHVREDAERAHVESPAVIVVGAVVDALSVAVAEGGGGSGGA